MSKHSNIIFFPLAFFGITFLCSGIASAKEPDFTASEAYINYYLPKTNTVLNLKLELKNCNNIEIAYQTTIVSTAVADTAREFQFNGNALKSFAKKREVTINLNENRTIKSINATIEDRTGAIISKGIKFIGGLLKLASAQIVPGSPPPPPSPICNSETIEQLKKLEEHERHLKEARERYKTTVLNSYPTDFYDRKITFHASEIARLKNDKLTLNLKRPLKFDTSKKSESIKWTIGELSKWFASDPKTDKCVGIGFEKEQKCKATTSLFSVNYTTTPLEKVGASTNSICSLQEKTRPQKKCGKTLIMRKTPKYSVLATKGSKSQLPGHSDTIAKSSVIVPQMGEYVYLPLDVGFAASKKFGLTFDSFGRTNSFSANTNASMESFVDQASGITTALSGVIDQQNPTDLALWKQEISELETQLKLNKLQLCKEIIESGGVECPD